MLKRDLYGVEAAEKAYGTFPMIMGILSLFLQIFGDFYGFFNSSPSALLLFLILIASVASAIFALIKGGKFNGGKRGRIGRILGIITLSYILLGVIKFII